MRKHLSIITAAAMSVAIAGISSVHAADVLKNDQPAIQRDRLNNQQALRSPFELKYPAGVKALEDAKANDLKGLLVELSGQLMEKDFEGMVDCFVDQDRNRLAKFEDQDMPKLDAIVDQIQQKWQAKYNEKLSLDDDNVAKIFVNAKAIRGEIEDPQALLAQWPMNVLPEGGTGEPVKASVQQPLTDEVRTQGNIAKGREIGVVYLPGEGDLPALQVSIIGEAFGWKLDVPNDRTGQQIHDDLVKHLSAINDNFDKLPADQWQAKRRLTYHVLMGVNGVALNGGEQNLDGPQILNGQPKLNNEQKNLGGRQQ